MKQKQKNYGFLALSTILSLSFSFILAGCGGSTNPTNKTASTPAPVQHVEAGNNAVINTADNLVATDKNSLNELQNDVSANNTQDVQTMVNNGQVLQLPNQTKVYVEDLSFSGVAHIRIDSGAYQGKDGYIPYEELTPVK